MAFGIVEFKDDAWAYGTMPNTNNTAKTMNIGKVLISKLPIQNPCLFFVSDI
jgi:hypothetical protein